MSFEYRENIQAEFPDLVDDPVFSLNDLPDIVPAYFRNPASCTRRVGRLFGRGHQFFDPTHRSSRTIRGDVITNGFEIGEGFFRPINANRLAGRRFTATDCHSPFPA